MSPSQSGVKTYRKIDKFILSLSGVLQVLHFPRDGRKFARYLSQCLPAIHLHIHVYVEPS